MSSISKGSILVTGAAGQIGSELTKFLREADPSRQVIATDLKPPPSEEGTRSAALDVSDQAGLEALVKEHKVTQVYHLAALLSAVGEAHPRKAWQVNVNGAINVLEVAAAVGDVQVFIPSSIAAFGPSTPLDHTPQDTIQRPTSMYGVTKVVMELVGDYYHKFGVDCRGVRLPGVISYKTPPGGGTTDYAIDMFVHALRGKPYTCYLKEDSALDMMYMPDALHAMTGVMTAPRASLQHANSFNVTAFQFTPAQLTAALQARIPGFVCHYEIDPVRQGIADSWPNSLDDSEARKQWGWAPSFTLDEMIDDMLAKMPSFLDSFPA